MTAARTRTARRPATDQQRLAGAIGIIAVAALAFSLLVAVQSPEGYTVEDGEGVGMTNAVHSGTTYQVQLPTVTVGLRMGDPLEEVERRFVDLPSSPDPHEQQDSPVRAPEGHVLLPVTRTVAAKTPEMGAEGTADQGQSTSAGQDTTAVDVRLVVDDETTQLIDDHQVQSVIEEGDETRLIPVDEETEVADITVEVTYDGATQTLTPEDGTIDSGAAAPLYNEDDHTFHTICGDGDCRMETADDSTWRHSPDRGEVMPGALTMQPYHGGLGWADEDRTWASVEVALGDSGSFYRSDGEQRGQESAPKTAATLDGVAAEDITWIDRSMDSKARLTFPVDADHTPRRLTLTQKHTLDDSKGTTVTTREQITVRDRD